MFRKIFSAEKIEASANYALFAGVFFTIVSFITSYLLFRKTHSFVGIATILFTVMLSLPIVVKFLESASVEEKSFFSKIRHLFNFYIYFFIGSFVVFFLISLVMPSNIFSAEQLYGTTAKLVPQKAGIPAPPVNENALAVGIFKNNLYVMAISFILSLLYGAGSLFLLTLNASIFASALSSVIRETAVGTGSVHLFVLFSCNMGIMFFHMIPEVIAYFFGAIGGGILSVASMKETMFSEGFFETLKYSLVIFAAAVLVLVAAAAIEVFISRRLLVSGICMKNVLGVLAAAAILIIAVVVFEIKRQRHAA